MRAANRTPAAAPTETCQGEPIVLKATMEATALMATMGSQRGRPRKPMTMPRK